MSLKPGCVKGILHIHSSYSRDGDMSLVEIKNYCRRRSLSFACITDHAEDLTQSDMTSLTEECDSLCEAGFVMIPGLEFALENGFHLLAVGMRSHPGKEPTLDILVETKCGKSILILAHPLKTGQLPAPQLLNSIDGVEVWNGGSDGGFVPSRDSYAFFEKAISIAPHLRAYGGADMHSIKHRAVIYTSVTANVSVQEIMGALAYGDCRISGSMWGIDSKARINLPCGVALSFLYNAYLIGKRIRHILSSFLSGVIR